MILKSILKAAWIFLAQDIPPNYILGCDHLSVAGTGLRVDQAKLLLTAYKLIWMQTVRKNESANDAADLVYFMMIILSVIIIV